MPILTPLQEIKTAQSTIRSITAIMAFFIVFPPLNNLNGYNYVIIIVIFNYNVNSFLLYL